MLGDHGFERPSFAERGRIFGAQAVEMVLAFGFLLALEFERLAGLGDFFGQRRDPLRDRFKFERQLAALAAESFHLCVGGCHFRLQPLRFAIDCSQALFRLRELVAQIGSAATASRIARARLFLLLLQFGQCSGRRSRLLLAGFEFLLRRGQIAGRRLQNLAVGIQFLFQRRPAAARLRQSRLPTKRSALVSSAQRSSLWRRCA